MFWHYNEITNPEPPSQKNLTLFQDFYSSTLIGNGFQDYYDNTEVGAISSSQGEKKNIYLDRS